MLSQRRREQALAHLSAEATLLLRGLGRLPTGTELAWLAAVPPAQLVAQVLPRLFEVGHALGYRVTLAHSFSLLYCGSPIISARSGHVRTRFSGGKGALVGCWVRNAVICG